MQLTGQPHAWVGLAEVSFVPDKRFQLLSYLAYHGDWIGRDRLAFLFWPDTDSANSRQNLRGLLRRLQSLPFDAGIEVTPHQMRWGIKSDLADYQEAVRAGESDRAVAAYQGPLLTGLEGDDSSEFDEWLEIEREKLHEDWRALVLQRLRDSTATEHQHARSLVGRLLEVDPLDEEAVRVFLEATARTGRLAEAKAVYQVFAGRLDKEMGLEPTSATVAAFDALMQAVERIAMPAASAAPLPVDAVGPPRAQRPFKGGLPTPATTFVGRGRELAEVEIRLLDDACQLLTLVGPGGVGKTRLALAAANRVKGSFEAGAIYVPLDAVSAPEELPQALAGALGIGVVGGEDVMAQIERELRGVEALLVIDNFEHLLTAADYMTRLLGASAGLKALVTSRERLGLQSEWLYPLAGLEFPEEPTSLAEISDFDAVTLFVERAQRVNPNFQVLEADVASIVQLCSLTEGMPLAIELAATWTRALPLASIAQEVSRSLDMLRSVARDSPARHSSIRATFEQSWNILSESERSVLIRLAVFRAGMTSPAAQFVAGASNAVMAALVDKSLIRLREDGRYSLHPLLRAFSLEKLRAEQEVFDRAERRHAAYYLRFLRERTDSARGPRPAATLAEIDAELPELLAAARAAKERGKGAQLVAFMRLLAVDTGYLPARGYGPGRLELLTAAGNAAVANGWLDAAHDLKGRLADAYSTYFGEPRKALKVYQEAAELAQQDGDAAREAVFRSMIGATRNDIDGSGEVDLDAALSMARAVDDDLCLATVLEHRAYVRCLQESWEEAGELYAQSLAAVDKIEAEHSAEPYEINRRRFFALINLGEVEQQRGRFNDSVRVRREALRIAEASGNPIWVAHAFRELGELYGNVNDKEAAENYLAQALILYRENHVTAQAAKVVALAQERGYELRPGVTVG